MGLSYAQMGFIIDGDEPKSEQTVLVFYQIELMHRPVNKENTARVVSSRQNISSMWCAIDHCTP